MFWLKNRWLTIAVFAVLLGLSGFSAYHKVEFSYDFEQFFPKGDPDLEFFYEFRDKFGADDNFMLIALESDKTIFDSLYLAQVADFTTKAKKLPHAREVFSITRFQNFVKTPFGIAPYPALHIKQPEKYAKDSVRLMNDERIVGQLITKDAKSSVVLISNTGLLSQDEAKEFIVALEELIAEYKFKDNHLLGRANFQKVFVEMQWKEFLLYTIASLLLVTIVITIIFRRLWATFIALVSVGLSMALFVGVLSLLGPFDAMTSLYPILMIIVGMSDVVHIMTKYMHELKSGSSKKDAITVTIKEIGLAILLTSTTTAIGFCSLITSKVPPIKGFGWKASIGVFIAYLTILIFTTALMTLFKKEQIVRDKEANDNIWFRVLHWAYGLSLKHKIIAPISVALLLIFAIGISQINTNVQLGAGLPKNHKITEDFHYFENEVGGFRPFEVAAIAQGDNLITDYEVVKQVDAMERRLREQPEIESINSYTTLYKTVNRAFNGDLSKNYKIAQTEKEFKEHSKFISRAPANTINVMVSEDKKYGRISAKVKDLGSDKVDAVTNDINDWVAKNTDTSLVIFNQTGTGIMFDKNNEYLRESLISGLGLAFIVISILMALLFRNARMLIISLIPNVFPLLLAGAIIGFAGIALDAPTSIIFAIAFGIAVDDTIHFLSKYKINRDKGMDMEKAIYNTFIETGKAISITSIILFFGFLILFTSAYPPTFQVGMMLSVTLFSALIGDLMILPMILRWLGKK